MLLSGLYQFFLSFLTFVAASTAFGGPPACATGRPIVGILTQPTQGDLTKYGTSRLQAGFVKWVEASGMRAVPIPFDAPHSKIQELFFSVNGVLFMGGPTNMIDQPTQYFDAAQLLYTLTVDVNLQGDYLPLWGTCLGFELLAIITSKNHTIMGETYYSSTNVSLPLNFTAEAASSRLFGSAPKDILETFSTQNVTDNEHHNAVTAHEFADNPILPYFYSVLSTNKDQQGREFISAIEAKQFPIYGVQWHPERTLFEWNKYQNINHDLASVECAQYVGRFFASEARKNCHHFPSPEQEQAALIYNYSPTYTMNVTNGSYEQIYFFG